MRCLWGSCLTRKCNWHGQGHTEPVLTLPSSGKRFNLKHEEGSELLKSSHTEPDRIRNVYVILCYTSLQLPLTSGLSNFFPLHDLPECGDVGMELQPPTQKKQHQRKMGEIHVGSWESFFFSQESLKDSSPAPLLFKLPMAFTSKCRREALNYEWLALPDLPHLGTHISADRKVAKDCFYLWNCPCVAGGGLTVTDSHLLSNPLTDTHPS